MKLPSKIWITEETAEYGGETEPYLSINDPADLSPGAVPYVPASEAEALREALRKIAKADCPSYVAHPQSVWWIEHVQSIAREALAAGEEKK